MASTKSLFGEARKGRSTVCDTLFRRSDRARLIIDVVQYREYKLLLRPRSLWRARASRSARS